MEIFNELINDIPLIIGICERVSIKKAIEENAGSHKNQQGLSNGELLTAWIGYILSEGDHRKSHVSAWAENHKKCLEAFFKKEIKSSEFSDDSLTGILSRLSKDRVWSGIEKDLWEGTVEVLDLPGVSLEKEQGGEQEKGREIWLDATSCSCHHRATEEGLLRYGGDSKDHRPDLPQVKMMVSVDKEFSSTIATDIAPGNSNDDILYLPNIKRVRETLGKVAGRNTLYSGDSKMSSLSIRSDIAKNEEYYVCPLQMSTKARRKKLSEAIEKAVKGEVSLEKLYRVKCGKKELIGYGYEYQQKEKIKKDKQEFVWDERLQVVQSLVYQRGEKDKLDNKINKAKAQIENLKGKQFPFSKEPEATKYIKEKVEEIIKQHSLDQLVSVRYKTCIIETERKRAEKRNGRVRKGKYTLKRIKVLPDKVELDKEKLQGLYDRLGWRIYVTNAPKERLSFQQSYNHYRGSQYIIENSFHVIKDKPIGIRPIFVWKDEQVKGLMRLLTLCLKVSTIISSKLRFSLQRSKVSLQEVYAGQPKKKTTSPMTKTILNLFYRQNIILSRVEIGQDVYWDISQMSKTCREILSHLGLVGIYQNIITTLKNREPVRLL